MDNVLASKARISCGTWAKVVEAFDSLPPRTIRSDAQGELRQTGWVFRGIKSDKYGFQPSIERAAEGKPGEPWAALELLMLDEFQSRARMHMLPSRLPELNDRLGWLALMQHYGVSTRLLDFTYSPYVALYFALRERTDAERSRPAEVWAIDAQAVDKSARRVESQVNGQPRRVSLNPHDSTTPSEDLTKRHERRREIVNCALTAEGARRDRYNKNGFVVSASPPLLNPRLSSQHGVFLLNAATCLTFEDSLCTMMQGQGTDWFRVYKLPSKALPEMEQRLFDMNIHDLSLFPDMEGLAGFIRQKAKLQWLF